MEDLIAYGLVIGVFALVFIAIGKLVKAYRSHMTLEAEHKAEVQQWLQRERDKMGYKNKPAFKVAANTRREEVKKKVETPTSTTSTSGDSLLTDLATLYVLNSALEHGSASAKVDYDAGTIKTDNSSSSSWGLDDSDSRNSISSSMSDSWSSSDSGPSSDW